MSIETYTNIFRALLTAPEPHESVISDALMSLSEYHGQYPEVNGMVDERSWEHLLVYCPINPLKSRMNILELRNIDVIVNHQCECAPLESVEARYRDLLNRLGVNGHSGAVAEIQRLREKCGLNDETPNDRCDVYPTSITGEQ